MAGKYSDGRRICTPGLNPSEIGVCSYNSSMKLKEVMSELEGLSDEKTRKHYAKAGAGDNMFGVKLGEIRKLAKRLKGHADLATDLWETGNVDARFTAILLFKPKDLSMGDMDVPGPEHRVRSRRRLVQRLHPQEAPR